MAYEIAFADSVKAHLQVLTARQRATVLEAIELQLTNEPLAETRNRKPSGQSDRTVGIARRIDRRPSTTPM